MDPRDFMVGAVGMMVAALVLWRALRSRGVAVGLDEQPVSDAWLAENMRARDPNAFL